MKDTINQIDINAALLKIELIWESLIKEKSEDIDAYSFIVSQSISLKMITFTLKDRIENQMLKDKKARIKLQKLHRALANILYALGNHSQKEIDTDHIEKFLKNLSKLRNDLEVIQKYQTHHI